MYGSVLGTSIAAGSVAVLPSTGGSKLSIAITLAILTLGVAITVITLARTVAARIFSA